MKPVCIKKLQSNFWVNIPGKNEHVFVTFYLSNVGDKVERGK